MDLSLIRPFFFGGCGGASGLSARGGSMDILLLDCGVMGGKGEEG